MFPEFGQSFNLFLVKIQFVEKYEIFYNKTTLYKK
jgi:hypothetical protein